MKFKIPCIKYVSTAGKYCEHNCSQKYYDENFDSYTCRLYEEKELLSPEHLVTLRTKECLKLGDQDERL